MRCADGFHMGRALEGSLGQPAASREWLARKARLGVVMRQQFGLRLDSLRELRLQDLGNALMIVLPRAPRSD